MSAQQIRTLAVDSLVPAADHSTNRGYFVKLDSNKKAALCTAATDTPYGAILDGENVDGQDSVAISGGNIGSIRIKVGGTVSKGQLGVLNASSVAIADPGTGARKVVCLFLEDGVVDELVEALLLLPDTRA